MSHFCVLVIGENPEAQLAPFQENNMGDCPAKYLKFNNVEPEYRKKWEKEKVERVQLADGTLVSPWDNQFRKPGTFGTGSDTHEIPAGLKKVKVSFKKMYKDFDKFISDWAGYKKDPKTKKYGYWENPNAKWDWFQVGGRWTGYFKLKPDANGSVGTPGLMTDPAEAGHADKVRIKDVDFDGMMADAGRKAGQKYDRVLRLLGGSIPKMKYTWKELMDEKKFKGIDHDDRRAIFNAQPAMRALEKAREDARSSGNKEDADALFWISLEDFVVPRDQYVADAEASAISTFAVLKDGKWYQRGEMGWWGIVTGEKNEKAWDKEFSRLVRGLHPETLLTLVDCHI